ncbi:MAG: DUF6348 family protein [Chryseobacterium jejuense]|uniref:DUF6348 family protein n=1 Tax=Chryseobacterium jejuense TaxID=445960 RepID=UPI003D123A17
MATSFSKDNIDSESIIMEQLGKKLKGLGFSRIEEDKENLSFIIDGIMKLEFMVMVYMAPWFKKETIYFSFYHKDHFPKGVHHETNMVDVLIEESIQIQIDGYLNGKLSLLFKGLQEKKNHGPIIQTMIHEKSVSWQCYIGDIEIEEPVSASFIHHHLFFDSLTPILGSKLKTNKYYWIEVTYRKTQEETFSKCTFYNDYWEEGSEITNEIINGSDFGEDLVYLRQLILLKRQDQYDIFFEETDVMKEKLRDCIKVFAQNEDPNVVRNKILEIMESEKDTHCLFNFIPEFFLLNLRGPLYPDYYIEQGEKMKISENKLLNLLKESMEFHSRYFTSQDKENIIKHSVYERIINDNKEKGINRHGLALPPIAL